MIQFTLCWRATDYSVKLIHIERGQVDLNKIIRKSFVIFCTKQGKILAEHMKNNMIFFFFLVTLITDCSVMVNGLLSCWKKVHRASSPAKTILMDYLSMIHWTEIYWCREHLPNSVVFSLPHDPSITWTQLIEKKKDVWWKDGHFLCCQWLAKSVRCLPLGRQTSGSH